MTEPALWTYQRERFPLSKTAPLLAVFSAASICASAVLTGRPLPGAGAYLAGFVIAMTLFFQMRVCDEVKDHDDDCRYRPHRPIPRGLVSLRLIVGLGVASAPLTALSVWAWHPPALWLLALVWSWLAVMTLEFGVPRWLKARPVLYLISHMAIMPLIDLLLTGLEWMPNGGPGTGLWLFLALSFVNGCVMEIGRKLWSPDHEIAGVETYSSLWGHRRAALIWCGCVGLSLVLLLGVGTVTGAFWISLPLGCAGAAICCVAAAAYARSPTVCAEKRMDRLAGLWVFACYAIAGFAPVVQRML